MHITLDTLTAGHPAAPAGIVALNGVSLSIASGEHVAIIGPSGAGKTTLLHALACAIKPLTGQLKMGDTQPWQLSTAQLQRLRGMLFLAPQVPPLPPRQRVVTAVSAALLPRMSVWHSLKNLFAAQHAHAVHQALLALDLGDKLFERVDRLSGGERQRVGLARAVLAMREANAQMLLVDEPLSALDPTRAAQALVALKSAAQDSKATLVCSLHQVDTALTNFPRIIGLRDGTVAFDLPAPQVTPALLQSLYGDKVHELAQPPVQVSDLTIATTAPAVMHCR